MDKLNSENWIKKLTLFWLGDERQNHPTLSHCQLLIACRNEISDIKKWNEGKTFEGEVFYVIIILIWCNYLIENWYIIILKK